MLHWKSGSPTPPQKQQLGLQVLEPVSWGFLLLTAVLCFCIPYGSWEAKTLWFQTQTTIGAGVIIFVSGVEVMVPVVSTHWTFFTWSKL